MNKFKTLWQTGEIADFDHFSHFVTMFLKIVCNRGVRKRLYVG